MSDHSTGLPRFHGHLYAKDPGLVLLVYVVGYRLRLKISVGISFVFIVVRPHLFRPIVPSPIVPVVSSFLKCWIVRLVLHVSVSRNYAQMS